MYLCSHSLCKGNIHTKMYTCWKVFVLNAFFAFKKTFSLIPQELLVLELIWQCESQRKRSVWSSRYPTLDAARPAENATAQNTSRILSRLTDPVLWPNTAFTWSLCTGHIMDLVQSLQINNFVHNFSYSHNIRHIRALTDMHIWTLFQRKTFYIRSMSIHIFFNFNSVLLVIIK